MKIIISLVIALILVAGGYLFIFNSQNAQIEVSSEKTVDTRDGITNIVTDISVNDKNVNGYYSVDSDSFEKLTTEEGVTVVNVHVPYGGEIANTDEFIPYTDIEKEISMLPEDKNSKIAVYCRSGGMSAAAARTLVSLGYTNVYDLTGGMNAYKSSGREVLNKIQ